MNEALMTVEMKAAAARLRMLEEKAALWDALLGAARLRPLGWAGEIEDNSVTHFGMEFWVCYPGHDFTESNARSAQLITAFARAARTASAEGALQSWDQLTIEVKS